MGKTMLQKQTTNPARPLPGLFLHVLALVFAAGFITTSSSVSAQDSMSSALSGFSSNSDEPISIEADTLEVREKESTATFTGNVVVKQGDVTIQTSALRVYYAGEGQGMASDQRIRRMETLGEVWVTSADQRARGDKAIFEAEQETIILDGNVVLTQGTNILRGTKMVVDLAAGTSRVFSASNGQGGSGRVQGLFQPNQVREAGADAAAPQE